MKLRTRAQIEIPRPRDQVFDFAVSAESFSQFLHKRGPVAGITGAEMRDGAELAVGEGRIIHMSDGVVLEEEILAFDRPETHRYRWQGGVKPPFSLLVKSGEGHWTFSDTDDGTHVDWSYTFELTNPLAYPLAAVSVLFFKSWMRSGLARARAILTETS